MPGLSTLDFAQYRHGAPSERIEFAKQLIESFQNYGFVKITNHGIPDERIRQLFDFCDRLFKLPLQTKQKLEMAHTGGPQRGYLSYGVEKTSSLTDLHADVEHLAGGEKGEDFMDERESFTMGPPDDDQYPNVWPKESDIPGFKEFAEEHFHQCRTISLHIIEATAMGLNVPATALLERCMPDRSEARFNFYPESSVEALSSGKSQRIWPHTDYGPLTLLFQDGVGGLELEDRLNGRRFIPVTTCSPGASTELIVNTGDTLQRWTNNLIRAGLHQVNIPPDLKRFTTGVVPRRLSYPFFLEADYDKSVGPLPQFVSEDHPAMYDEITSIQYHSLRVDKQFPSPPQANGVQ